MRSNVGITEEENKILHAVFLSGAPTEEEKKQLFSELALIGKSLGVPEKEIPFFAEDGVALINRVGKNSEGDTLLILIHEKEEAPGKKDVIVYGRPFPVEDGEEEIVDVVSYGFLYPFFKRIVVENVSEYDSKKLMVLMSLAYAFRYSIGDAEFTAIKAEEKDGMYAFVGMTVQGVVFLFRIPQTAEEEKAFRFIKDFYNPEMEFPEGLRKEFLERKKEGDVGMAIWCGENSFFGEVPLAAAFTFFIPPEKCLLKSILENMGSVYPFIPEDEDIKKVIAFQETFGVAYEYFNRFNRKEEVEK